MKLSWNMGWSGFHLKTFNFALHSASSHYENLSLHGVETRISKAKHCLPYESSPLPLKRLLPLDSLACSGIWIICTVLIIMAFIVIGVCIKFWPRFITRYALIVSAAAALVLKVGLRIRNMRSEIVIKAGDVRMRIVIEIGEVRTVFAMDIGKVSLGFATKTGETKSWLVMDIGKWYGFAVNIPKACFRIAIKEWTSSHLMSVCIALFTVSFFYSGILFIRKLWNQDNNQVLSRENTLQKNKNGVVYL